MALSQPEAVMCMRYIVDNMTMHTYAARAKYTVCEHQFLPTKPSGADGSM